MKILVTGAKGFIGKNLSLWLQNAGYEVLPYEVDSDPSELEWMLKEADFIFHLAGINRPLKPEEFIDGNVNFTKRLLDLASKVESYAPIVFSSSTQAEKDNPYGLSKKAAEDLLFKHSKANGTPVYVYRLYNVFGKWCRPSYNSVIATWCYNIAHDLPVEINESAPPIDFIYIDDVCREFLEVLQKRPEPSLKPIYPKHKDTESLKDILQALRSFKEIPADLLTPDLKPGFYKNLYSTYLTYLEPASFLYPLHPHADERGSFTEAIKSLDRGQVSINVAHPGIVKGNHYHMSKTEKYLVLKGKCRIKMRKLGSNEVFSFDVDGDHPMIVDIIPGYTHSIETLGNEDSITLMWASELFDPENPDTIYCPVEEE